MGQTRLNMCMLLRVHNDNTNALDLKQIANKCVPHNSSQQSVFENFEYCMYFYAFHTAFFVVYPLFEVTLTQYALEAFYVVATSTNLYFAQDKIKVGQ